MPLPPQFLDEIRARLPLSDLVNKRLRLLRAGREWKAPCPFHREKTPSFYVNDSKGFFHCFGCGAHGDVISFVMRHDNLSFPETIELLAGEAGLQVPKSSVEERRKYERQKSLYDLIERAAQHYESQLLSPAGRQALAYLKGRGLADETIARFRLGYAPHDGGPLKADALKAGFTEADLVEAGLFRQPDDGRSAYAFFRHRVLFPVADRRGRIVAFGGRLIEGDGPKYVNSQEHALFHKGSLLYGMSRARQAASDGATLVVTEGYMDVIACHAAGFEGAVAPLGTALTETQIQELWKLAPERRRTPILCFDGDNAGRRAALRAVERLLPALLPDHSARVAFLPDKEDPDSLIRAGGAAAFQAVLDRARPLADVLWESEAAGRDLAIPDHRAGLESALAARCAKIGNATVRRAYEADMKDRLFRAGRANRLGPVLRDGPQRRPAGGPVDVRDSRFNARWNPKSFRSGVVQGSGERLLLTILLNHPGLFDAVGETLGNLTFRQGQLESVRREVVACLSANSALDADGLRVHLSRHGHGEFVSGLLSGVTDKEARPDTPADVALRGWRQAYEILMSKQVSGELRNVNPETEEGIARIKAINSEVARALSIEGDIEE